MVHIHHVINIICVLLLEIALLSTIMTIFSPNHAALIRTKPTGTLKASLCALGNIDGRIYCSLSGPNVNRKLSQSFSSHAVFGLHSLFFHISYNVFCLFH